MTYKSVFVVQTNTILESETLELIAKMLERVSYDGIIASYSNQPSDADYLYVPNATKDGAIRFTKN